MHTCCKGSCYGCHVSGGNSAYDGIGRGNGRWFIGITAQPIPAETPTIDISPSIENEEVTTIPIPDEATKADNQTKKGMPGCFYITYLSRPGISVDLRFSFTFQQALDLVHKGIHVCTPVKSYAGSLAFFASDEAMQQSPD